ncbi:aconitase/3-isopropylmalate dehydratase large subunit family protein [Candidatus Riflebacteria bacterium]
MGKTIVEKILSSKSGREANAGDTVLIDLDVRSARDFGGANVVKNFQREYEGEKVADVEKTFFTFDCVVPANNIPYANNQQIARIFAREQNIPLYDVDAGIGSHVVIEKGHAFPGATVVGTDSHLNIMGSIGALGQGMGDTDITFAFKTGKTWFEVPHTIKLDIRGELLFPVTAKDLTLAVVRHFGAKGALGQVVEVYGGIIDSLDLAGRITLSSMGTETGAIAIMITPDVDILGYCEQRSGKKLEYIFADPDANYSEIQELDLPDLEPLISKPGHPEDVVTVKEVAGRRVDSVFIGSCTNGRMEDYELVARIIGKQKVAPHVMAKLVPATKEVYGRLMESGLMQKFFNSGFIISNQGCGGCASGQIGMTGKEEVQISTSNRNFKGKQGMGDTYLASPATAAASAIKGVITDPRELS